MNDTEPRKQLVNIINNLQTDLFAPVLNARKEEHNVLYAINSCATHNAYHIGEIGIARHVMGLWPETREGILD